MKNKFDFIGLYFNAMLPLFIILLVIFNKTDSDPVILTQKYYIFDIVFGLMLIAGIFVGPAFLVYNFIKTKENDCYTLLISLLLIIAAVVLIVYKFKIISFRIFLFPSVYIVLYTCCFLLKNHLVSK